MKYYNQLPKKEKFHPNSNMYNFTTQKHNMYIVIKTKF